MDIFRQLKKLNVHRDTKLLSISSWNIDRFLKFFHYYCQQEICNKKITTDPITSKRCRYNTLQNISLQKWKMASTDSTVTADHVCAHTEENVTAAGAINPLRPATNSSFNTLNSMILGRTNHVFHCDLGLKCLKRRLLDIWLKQTAMQDSLFCSKQLLNDVIFIHIRDKTLFTLATLTN